MVCTRLNRNLNQTKRKQNMKKKKINEYENEHIDLVSFMLAHTILHSKFNGLSTFFFTGLLLIMPCFLCRTAIEIVDLRMQVHIYNFEERLVLGFSRLMFHLCVYM